MPIKIVCDCGNKFRVGDSFRGGQVRCPKCRQMNDVPAETISLATLRCPSCESDVDNTAVLCVNCGYDFRTGKRHETEVAERPYAAGGGAWTWLVFRRRFKRLLLGIGLLAFAIVGSSGRLFPQAIPPATKVSDEIRRLAAGFQTMPSVLPENESKFLVAPEPNVRVKIAFPSVSSLLGQWRMVSGKVEVKGSVQGKFQANDEIPAPEPWQEKGPPGEAPTPRTNAPQFDVTLPVGQDAVGKPFSATATLELVYPELVMDLKNPQTPSEVHTRSKTLVRHLEFLPLSAAEQGPLQEWSAFEARRRANPALYVFPYWWWASGGIAVLLIFHGVSPLLRYSARVLHRRLTGRKPATVGQALWSHCWFCESNKVDSHTYAEVRLIHPEHGLNFEHAKVPRCRRCRGVHNMLATLPVIIGGILAILAAIPAMLFLAWWGAMIAILVYGVGYAVGLAVAGVLLQLRYQGRVKSQGAVEDFPPILEKMQDGWQILDVDFSG